MTPTRAAIEAVYREGSRQVLASLARLLGDLDLAEEALHEACAAALERWPQEGIPAAPRSWLITVGRYRAIDALRRRARFDAAWRALAERVEVSAPPAAVQDDAELPDDRLRLLLACCHPALTPRAQVALTLREVCGLTTEEVARACLARAPTVAQRIVRAKAELRGLGRAFELPARRDLPARLDQALKVVYLVFNEGYAASRGEALQRADLAQEALRLARLLRELCPEEAEVQGLLGLLLLHHARRAARSAADGSLVTLEDQDRGRWDRAAIAEGAAHVEAALRTRRFGPYTLQAAIVAVHCEAPSLEATDWVQIVGLYDLLLRVEPTPVVALNRAVAVAQRDGEQAGLALVEPLLAELAEYAPAHAAHADLCRRLGRVEDARASYARARELTALEPERAFYARRLAELE